ncbi:MAG: helix-turn-helix transcriptional regulator [Acidothermales bacterium]|nr:helix-turn-helix transcriptional regulator [Acidothermales bacterium]
MTQDAPAPHGDEVVVLPVVVVTQTFTARPSSLPDAEHFVRENVPTTLLDPAEMRTVYAAIRDAILAAANPDIGSFQITVRCFPEDVEIEVLSSADPPTRASLPPKLADGTFADWLARNLRSQGLSQEAAARRLGVSVRTISRWVRGQTEPRLRDLRRVEEMLGGSAQSPPSP